MKPLSRSRCNWRANFQGPPQIELGSKAFDAVRSVPSLSVHVNRCSRRSRLDW